MTDNGTSTLTPIRVTMGGRQLAELPEVDSHAAEPLTYTRHGKHSYFADLVRYERSGDRDALSRLERHEKEITVEFERRAARASRAPQDGDRLELRVPPNWSAGTGGYFAPPLWLIDMFAVAPRPGRVLADLAPNFDLPVGFSSVNLPRLTTGAELEAQVLNATAPDRDYVDAAGTSTVVTIAGNEDVPLQMLEQSPPSAALDWVIFTDMQADYDFKLEQQLLIGTGAANGQLPGMISMSTSGPQGYGTAISYTGAVQATTMFPFIGQTMASVGLNRKRPPEVWLISTPRVAWVGSSEDTQNRPLMVANSDGTGNFDLLSIEVAIDDALPRTMNGNQEPIVACRPSDLAVLESEQRTDVLRDVLSGQLAVRLQMRQFVAAVPRYPSSAAYLTGSGMVPAAGF